ncbi:MAG: glycerophosphodiester phosphodiesterase family protein [Nocardioides sp.]|jgi:glycerophosphoryl diester phosphodiesterase
MRVRLLALALALPAALLTPATAAQSAAARATAAQSAAAQASADGSVDWLKFRVANMAHSGGENEAPTNTMYAFKRAKRLGADVLELDVQSTKDKQLAVIHNATIDETTDGTGFVKDLTLKQVQSYDAAHWFVPKKGTTHDARKKVYTLRGARYGERKIKGYRKTDFAVPALDTVFKRFKTTPINIEIKGTNDFDVKSFKRAARLLAAFLKDNGRTDVIVTSFNDDALALFHKLAPKVPLAPGRQGLLDYYLQDIKPIEGTVALQVPVTYEYGGTKVPVVTKEFVARAHADGYAVHVWFSGTAPDDAATYKAMIATCADGLMPARPKLFERILDKGGYERPGTPGVNPCA